MDLRAERRKISPDDGARAFHETAPGLLARPPSLHREVLTQLTLARQLAQLGGHVDRHDGDGLITDPWDLDMHQAARAFILFFPPACW